MSAKRFRIAFSFAGEKRDFVAKVAAIVAMEFGKKSILYDKYHEVEFAHAGLAFSLPELYHNETDLIVAVFCPDYDTKEWCGLEWSAIYGLIKQGKVDQVMLTRFDRVEGKGLYGLAGFIELDHKTPDQAALLILEGLALLDQRCKEEHAGRVAASVSPAPTSTLNNLPPLQSFFGRSRELADLAEALDPQTLTRSMLIYGPGGMGKTSLAVRAAYNCPPGQFQRIIFVSVKQKELDEQEERKLDGLPLSSWLETLNEIARELGQPDIAKAPEDQRIILLLNALRPARVLLILDNLEALRGDESDQLITFVNGLPQGCKAILTSRIHIDASPDVLVLEMLDQAAALATLADLARRNKLLAKASETERMALYIQTGGRPLLLRWVAGQLGLGSCTTIADALDALRSCPNKNNALAFIFNDLLASLTPEETRILATLAYPAQPIPVAAIAEISEVPERDTLRFLKALTNRALVVPDQAEANYALVPMVADFVRNTKPEVVVETGTRLEKRAYKLIVENGYHQYDLFPVLDAAWPTVAPALPLFVVGLNPRLQTACEALNAFFNFTGRWDEQLSLSQQAEAKAVEGVDYASAGRRAFDAGWIHHLRQQPDAVLACADRAAAHWQTAQAGVRMSATASQLRGIGHCLKANYPAAIAAFHEALELDRSLCAESEHVAFNLNWLSNAEKDSGDLTAAEQHYHEALGVARAVGYAEGVVNSTSNLADLTLDREDWKGAETLAREAYPLAEKVRRLELIADNCHRLAVALVRQAKTAEAQPYAQRAVNIFTQLVSPSLQSARATLRECEA